MERRTTHVLIVDDDPGTRLALARLFEGRGLRVVAASTVTEALALLQTQPASVVLDLDLPDGRGELILRTVREQGLPLRVCVCTAAVDPARLENVARLGPDALLAKPVEFEVLVAACCGPEDDTPAE